MSDEQDDNPTTGVSMLQYATSHSTLDNQRSSTCSPSIIRKRSRSVTQSFSLTWPPALYMLSRSDTNSSASSTVSVDSFVEEEQPEDGDIWLQFLPFKEEWVRGESILIRWKCHDPHVKEIEIQLRSRGFEAPTFVARRTKNKGEYLYRKVPWGMPIRGDYYLQAVDLETKRCVCRSSFFPISR